MHLRLRLYADRVEATFTDDGVAHALRSETSNSAATDLREIPEGGFGLAIARKALDGLLYQRTPEGVNCWRLIKWFSPS